MRIIINAILWSFVSPLIVAQKSGHELRFKLRDYLGKEVYLGFNYGDKKYLLDTASLNSKTGEYIFSGEKPLDGGIYLLILPSKRYMEFIVDEQQHFSIETDTVDFVKNARVKGSASNTVFFDYLKTMGPKQELLYKYIKRLDTLPESHDSIKIYREWSQKLEREINEQRLQIIDKYPHLFVGRMFRSMREPDLPAEAPLLPDGRKDSTYAYRYFRQHYFDGFAWDDDKLARTPILHNKLKFYLEKLIPPVPDSVIAAADWLVGQAQKSKENFKYTVHYITSTYERSPIMGMEAVFVHMAKKYYTRDKAFWADSATISKIQERARALEPLLIGKPAPNLILPDTALKTWYNLSKVDAPYTILVFWSPECGHCQKAMPKLKEIYDQWKSKGVKVYAVCTERNMEKWKSFVREKNLDWINVAVHPIMAEKPEKFVIEQRLTDVQSLNFHKTYDIYSTPQIYVLDRKKTIVGRRLSVEDLEGFLKKLFEKVGS
ncbi:MAG: DUF5106 domain-containing protein [Flavobacteriales bacterium]|nr:DUF5106 domain-containing protein [Flavobacteriales bacterium]